MVTFISLSLFLSLFLSLILCKFAIVERVLDYMGLDSFDWLGILSGLLVCGERLC